MSGAPLHDAPEDLRRPFPVAVLLERRPAAVGRWTTHVWAVTGLVAGDREADHEDGPRLIHERDGVRRYLASGLRATLHVDECESYYHNLMTATPRAYVVARCDETDDERRPEPFLVSLSFDEAHAYLEADDEVYAVDIPPALYRRTEAFVLAHYVPEKKYKRKRQDWKRQDQTFRGRAP